MIAECFEKLIKFAPTVSFDVVGSTIGLLEGTDTQVTIRLDRGTTNLAVIAKKDGTFEQYSISRG